MTPTSKLSILCGFLACSTALSAQDYTLNFDPENFRVATGISTFGYTISADYRLNRNWGVRGVFGYSEIETEVVKEGIQVVGTIFGQDIYTDFPVLSDKVNTEAQTGGYGVLIDYYPNLDSWGDGFRVTGGAMGTLYQLDGYGVVDGIVQPHSNNRFAVHDLTLEMDIPSISPYVGLGYNHKFNEHWGINIDAGVMYNVRYDGKMSGTALYPEEQAYVDAELNQEMETKLKELEPYPFLPFVFIGASYSF